MNGREGREAEKGRERIDRKRPGNKGIKGGRKRKVEKGRETSKRNTRK